jgi:hypothetical protein
MWVVNLLEFQGSETVRAQLHEGPIEGAKDPRHPHVGKCRAEQAPREGRVGAQGERIAATPNADHKLLFRRHLHHGQRAQIAKTSLAGLCLGGLWRADL